MKKTIFLLFTVVSLVGCTQAIQPTPTVPPTQPVTIIEQTAVASPTAETLPLPTETATLIAVTLPPPALPVCSEENSITGCEVPTAKELDRFCTNEKPYTLYAFPPGTSVEAVTPNFTCHDEGIRKGNQQYSCTGAPSYSFRARVCNAACVAPVNQESDQCPRGYGINTANNCCVPVQNTVNGCVELSLHVGVCAN